MKVWAPWIQDRPIAGPLPIQDNTKTYIHSSNRIRNQEPIVRELENIPRLTSYDHCDQRLKTLRLKFLN
jgi:hypothetical protein